MYVQIPEVYYYQNLHQTDPFDAHLTYGPEEIILDLNFFERQNRLHYLTVLTLR